MSEICKLGRRACIGLGEGGNWAMIVFRIFESFNEIDTAFVLVYIYTKKSEEWKKAHGKYRHECCILRQHMGGNEYDLDAMMGHPLGLLIE